MIAARFHAATKSFGLEEVGIPQPGYGEVLVRVVACGICTSDVHLVEGMLPSPIPDVTPGHEAAGIIDSVGPGVPPTWREGIRVVINPGRACGHCWACLQRLGQDSCVNLQVMGAFYDGAWAEYVIVGYEQLVEVPIEVPLEEAAILADALTTPYAALRNTAALKVAESIGIWGLGGLGTHAVQIAYACGATPIIAVDVRPGPRDRALRLGADAALDPNADDFAEQMLTLTGGRGLDVAAEFVGINAVRAQSVASLGQAGRAVLVGLTPEPIELTQPLAFQQRMQSVTGHFGGGVRELQQLVALTASNRLDLTESVSAVMPLVDVEQGIARLVSRDDDPVRLVVAP
jgi:threonine dehydrogenase-like Zn-dependent dehydrogenase